MATGKPLRQGGRIRSCSRLEPPGTRSHCSGGGGQLRSQSGWGPRKAEGERKPERASFPFKSPDGRRPDPAARGRKCRERFPSELPESLFGRRPGRAASLGGGLRAEPCAPWRPRSRRRRRRRRPPRSPPGAPPPGPSPGPAPGPGPRRPRGAPRARAGERAPLTRSSRSAPRSRRSQVHVRPADCPRSRRGRAERGRERPPARVTLHAAPRRRCHPGPATPTFRTVAELEVSGLRGRWAGFLQCRLSLATKRESRPGEGRKERNTMGRGPATEKSPRLEIPPPEAFFGCFFLSGAGELLPSVDICPSNDFSDVILSGVGPGCPRVVHRRGCAWGHLMDAAHPPGNFRTYHGAETTEGAEDRKMHPELHVFLKLEPTHLLSDVWSLVLSLSPKGMSP
ncbi:proapoptotic nucleolar protein 1 [Balaenoptera musculus]|uniref:Proapoptotic nucleolar protein 1 n=1 Tax=Balaenoptera musculus TaxID=9771 RepID=A0A8B8YNG0_BALMU|nr:proapoptotic nucleolar protein 1 [Balaenoptera musculus]